jgi:hypothetical protein
VDIFTRKDLGDLMAAGKPCVSLFMPTRRKGPETRQNHIRFKNLLGQAQEKLEQMSDTDDLASRILEPAQPLLADTRYWHFQSDGFVLFLSEKLSRTFRLPIRWQELVVVGDHFHLKPLIPFITDNMRWYVLALSQEHPGLYQCTRQQIQEVEAGGMPKSLAEAMRYEEPIKHFTMQPSSTLRSTGRSTMLHGHGGATDEAEDRILQYFRQLNQGIHDLLGGESHPLVLAGLDHLLPLYREANTYPHLLDEELAANPKELSDEELHRRAWALVEPQLEKTRGEAISRYRNLMGTGRTSSALPELLPAAHFGRIETLFVVRDQEVWGIFEPEENRMEVHQDEKPGDEDLLNSATLLTLTNGGTVYAVDQKDMPDDSVLAAVLRY